MKHLLVPGLAAEIGDRVTLPPPVTHHLINVVRARRGTKVVLTNGDGALWDGTLEIVVDGAAVVAVNAVRGVSEQPPLHLILGLPKGPAMDLAVRMATEAGVTDIHPVIAQRSVATGDRIGRWQRIAAAACGQCKRPDVPTVHAPGTLIEAIDALPKGLQRIVALPTAAGKHQLSTGPTVVAIGPEGGFTDAECQLLTRHEFTAARFGRWVFRTETAVAAVLSRF